MGTAILATTSFSLLTSWSWLALKLPVQDYDGPAVITALLKPAWRQLRRNMQVVPVVLRRLGPLGVVFLRFPHFSKILWGFFLALCWLWAQLYVIADIRGRVRFSWDSLHIFMVSQRLRPKFLTFASWPCRIMTFRAWYGALWLLVERHFGLQLCIVLIRRSRVAVQRRSGCLSWCIERSFLIVGVGLQHCNCIVTYSKASYSAFWFSEIPIKTWTLWSIDILSI